MNTNQDNLEIITRMVIDYFEGLHYGDTDKLSQLFHDDAVLKAPGLRRSLPEWLDAVARRPVPSEEGHPYRFRILAIEIIGDQAMVKVDCPLFDHAYVDFLGFLKEGGRWRIVNKMYADQNPAKPNP